MCHFSNKPKRFPVNLEYVRVGIVVVFFVFIAKLCYKTHDFLSDLYSLYEYYYFGRSFISD